VTATTLDALALAQFRVLLASRLDLITWQRALASLRDAIERDSTVPVPAEIVAPGPAAAAEEATP
jgi:hypothetical protein